MATATQVESLEPRRVLAPVFQFTGPTSVTISEESQHFPYPTWSQPWGTVITTVGFIDTLTHGSNPAIPNIMNNDIKITGGNSDNAFNVDQTNGDVWIQNPAALDADRNPSFTLTIQRTDDQGQVATGTLTVSLVDVYERPVIPQFPYQNGTFGSNIFGSPSSEPGGTSQRIGPTQLDLGPDDINPHTGDSVTSDTNFPTSSLDYSATGVGVNLLRVKENSPSGTVVGQVYAISPDSPSLTSTLTYSFQGAVPGFSAANPAISIDKFTGIVRVLDPAFFNYEALRSANLAEGDMGEGVIFSDGNGGSVYLPGVTLRVQVRATDLTGLPGNFSQTTQPGGGISDSFVYIRVLDVGEVPPDVSRATTDMSVNEGVLAGDSPVSGAAINTQSVGFFQMINGTPNTFTAFGPDYLTVDPSGNSVRIAAPASVIGLPTVAGQQRYSYKIVGGQSNGEFAINQDTGEVTVANASKIDFETLKDYTLQIQVTSDNQNADFLGTVQDVAPLSTIASLHVHVTDVLEKVHVFAPDTTGNNKPFTIPEGSVNGTIVGSATVVPIQNPATGNLVPLVPIANAIAVYADDTTQPNGKAQLSYSITSGNFITISGVQYSGIFAINSATGVISVNNTTGLPNTTVLNFLQQQKFQLVIEVRNHGDAATSGNAAVEIDLRPVDSTPPNISPGFATIREFTGASVADPVNGAAVGNVVASAGQPDFSLANYSITGGNSVIINGNPVTPFAIDATTGLITINDVTGLDYEVKSVFVLTIKVTDNGFPVPLSSTSTFTITLLDENDPIKFQSPTFNFALNENSPNSFLVGTLSTSDEDPLQGKIFQITGGNTGNAFAIDAQGHITVATSSALDFETTPIFNLAVTVTDTGNPPTSDAATVTINLNNQNDAPKIGNQTFQLVEHSYKAGGFPINPLTPPATNALGASDQDLPAQTLTFAITAGNPNGLFTIDPATGVISVSDPGLIDFATQSSYALTVKVTDDGSNGINPPFAPASASATITIQLQDASEPQLTALSNTIPENPNVGDPVFPAATVNGGSAPYTFSIFSGNANNAFAIDPATGAITVNNPAVFDFETNPTMTFKVLVVDSQANPLGDTATYTLTLTNVNEAPVLSSIEPAPLNYIENGVTPVTGTIVATDPDVGDSASGATVQITGGYINGQDTLVFSTISNITGVFDPTSGKLTLTGNDTYANYQAALRSVAYKNLSDNPSVGPRTVSFQISDAAGLPSNVLSRGISITPVNDPPLLSSIEPTPLNYAENATLAVTSTIAVSDPDSANMQGATVKITGNYISGQDTLVFTNTAKITGTFSAATGTMTLTGVDTVANYTAALRAVKYLNTSNNPSALTRTVSITVTDTGALNSNTLTRSINVIPSNDPPSLINIETTPLSYTENATTAVTSTIVASDPDSTQAQSATIQISVNYVNGEDTLVFANTLKIFGNWDATTGTLTLTGTDTLTNYRAALRSVKYTNSSDNPSLLTRTVSFTITDDSGATSAATTRKISINRVNDPPVLASIVSNVAYTEGQGAVAINNAITVNDPDSATLLNATVTLTNFKAAEDVLGFVANPATMGNIVLASNANGVLTLTSFGAAATLGQWQNALRAVTYTNVSGNLNPPAKQFTFSADDGSSANNISNSLNSTINVTAIFPPALSGSATLGYTEKNAPTPINTVLTVTDPGTLTLATATITITNFVAGQDVLGFVNNGSTMGNIAIQSNANGVLTLKSTGSTATLAQWQAALRAVTYKNTSSNPDTTARTVNIQVSNGLPVNALSNVLSNSVTIAPVNDAPVLSGIEAAALGYAELTTNVNVTSAITISDVDSLNLKGATIQITGNYLGTQDVLQFTDTSNITGSYNPATGKLTLTGNDTLANYVTALRSVTYFNSSNNPNLSPRTVTFIVTDDGSLNSNAVTRTINIIPFNDPPVLSSIEPPNLQYIENTVPNYSANNTTPISQTIQVNDPDSTMLSGAVIQIAGNYQSGQDFLVFTNTAKIKGTFDATTGTLTLTGADTLANYTAALESVSFFDRQDNPSTLTRTVTFQVSDNLGAPSNQLSRDIDITPVNDPPLVTMQDTTALAYTENAAAKPIAPNLLVTDPDSNLLQSATIRITGNYNSSQDKLVFSDTATITGSWNAATGTLTLNGLDTISNYRTALRSVGFFNQHDGKTTPARIVSFNVTDDSGLTGNTVTRSINITTVNDASILSGIEASQKIFKAKDPFTPPTPITSSLVITDFDSAFINKATVKITGNYIAGQDRLGFSITGTNITGSLDLTTGTLTLSGKDTIANYQKALRSVVYYNISSTPNTAPRTVTFQVIDDTNLPSNTQSRGVSIVTTNTPPSVSLNSVGALQYTEKDPATPVAPQLTIIDPDSPNIQGAIIKITGNYQSAEDRLAFTTSGNIIKGTFDLTTGTLTLTGNDTLAHYQDALRTVSYVNLSNNPNTSTRSINFVVNDGLNPSGAINFRNVSVTPLNDPPTVAINSTALSYTPSQGAVKIAPSLTVTDPDNSTLQSASVQITFNYERGKDVLAFTNTAKITGVFDASTGTLKLTGVATLAEYRDALRSVTYKFVGTPITSTKIVSITASDGLKLSSPANRNINIS